MTADGVEALYPFLYATEGDLDSVLRQVAQSTIEKVAEVEALRASVVAHDGARMEACAAAMAASFKAGGRLLAFGNGGSSTDAHDIVNLFLAPHEGRPLPALALTADVAVVTALANDVGFDVVFARQVAAWGRPGDMAFAVSTSGGSENVVRGLDEAKQRGLLTVGLAGYDGGRMAEAGTVDFLFVVPSSSVHRIQEAQTTVYHLLWALTQQVL
ncbi:MAG: D-sedoheptulose 7-phosphate isomerase [Actinomycetota bacterium]|jgi:D-sedoheptulose 7-phosphate isomerase|nr:D-sedoheptulose 7-phosphate isomerase [Actinomycetota bacterium]